MTFEEILGVFEARREGASWMAFCPSHPDGEKSGRRSLHIARRKDDRGTTLHCFSGCETEAILEQYELTFADLYDDPLPERKETHHVGTRVHQRGVVEPAVAARRQPVDQPGPPDPGVERPAGGMERLTEYIYTDEEGTALFVVMRTDRAGGGKTFTQARADGIKSLDGVRRVPYMLPRILEARGREPVFLVEGEKCAEAVLGLGLVGTTLAGGAGAKWIDDQASAFDGAVVVLLPDYDDPGAKWAAVASEALQGHAKRVHLVELPHVPPKGDVADWVELGGTREELLALIPRPMRFLTSEDVKNLPAPQFLDDARQNRIPLIRGDTAILAGPSNVGKSFLSLDWACELALLGKRVLYLALEDLHGNGVRLRAWEEAHTELARVEWNTEEMYLNLTDDEQVTSLCEAIEGYDLVVIDNLNESGYEDENDPIAAGKVAASLKRLSRSIGDGVILAVHNFGHGAARIRGHSKLLDRIDTVIYAKSMDDEDEGENVFTVWSGKQRHGRRFSAYRLQRVEVGPSVVLYEAPPKPDPYVEAVMAGYVTPAEMIEQLGESRSKVFKRLAELVKEGKLTRHEGSYAVAPLVHHKGITAESTPPKGGGLVDSPSDTPPLEGGVHVGEGVHVRATGLVETMLDGTVVQPDGRRRL